MAKKLHRDAIREKRKDYYVTYQPADDRGWLATLNIVYVNDPLLDSVEITLREELLFWLNKYPIPLFAAAFDKSGGSFKETNFHLCGYRNLDSGAYIIDENIKDDDFPSQQKTSIYQSDIYKEINFKYFDSEQAGADYIQKSRFQKKIILLLGISSVVFPIVIEIIAMGVVWFNWSVIIIGWSIALVKIGKLYGYISPNKYELDNEKKKSKMEHYYYHCERNPKTFEILRNENIQKDLIQGVKDEYNNL